MLFQKRFYIIIINLFFIWACNSASSFKSPLDDFLSVDSITLKGQNIHMENDSTLYDPRTITLFDSLAIFNDNNGISGFSIVNLNNGKLIRRFAFTGGGDTNFNINSLTLRKIVNTEKKFSILETSPPYRVFLYDLDSLIKNNNYHPSSWFTFPKNFEFADILLLNNSSIFGKIDFSKYDSKMFGTLNIHNNKLVTAVDLPSINDPRYDEFYEKQNISWTKNTLLGSFMKRPNSGQMAYFSSKGALIQIFDINKNFSVNFQKLYYLPDFTIVDHGNNVVSSLLTDDCKYGFNNIAVTKDRIYALFNGKPANTDKLSALSGNVILVYDWNGKPIQKIRLERSCYQIAIDPQKPHILYALSAFENKAIIKYNLR